MAQFMMIMCIIFPYIVFRSTRVRVEDIPPFTERKGDTRGGTRGGTSSQPASQQQTDLKGDEGAAAARVVGGDGDDE